MNPLVKSWFFGGVALLLGWSLAPGQAIDLKQLEQIQGILDRMVRNQTPEQMKANMQANAPKAWEMIRQKAKALEAQHPEVKTMTPSQIQRLALESGVIGRNDLLNLPQGEQKFMKDWVQTYIQQELSEMSPERRTQLLRSFGVPSGAASAPLRKRPAVMTDPVSSGSESKKKEEASVHESTKENQTQDISSKPESKMTADEMREKLGDLDEETLRELLRIHAVLKGQEGS